MAAGATGIPGQSKRWTMYACGAFTENYVVGAKLVESGLFRQRADGSFEHLGPSHPAIRGMAFAGDRIYLAAGNGCVRVERGEWRQTTGWEVTEPMGVEVDPFTKGRVYLALPDGVYVSGDGGERWAYSNGGWHRPYVQTVVADRYRKGVLLAGGESGLYRSEDAGASWTRVAEGMFTAIAQVDERRWWAGRQWGGLFRSMDGGRRFRVVEGVPAKATIYGIATEGTKRVAVTSWDFGLLETEDGGGRWRERGPGDKRLWTVAYDRREPGTLWVNMHEKGLLKRDGGEKEWKPAGLPGTVIYQMAFVEEQA
jgi:photosystem II stability/assembly factor-like uncharacterized protein